MTHSHSSIYKALGLLIIAATIAFSSPRFDVDGVPVDLNEPQVGAPIVRVNGSVWWVAFEDLTDWDMNDGTARVEIYETYSVMFTQEGLSAHPHTYTLFDNGVQVSVGMRDEITNTTYFTGTVNAWVECLTGCESAPAETPEPSSYLLIGGGLLAVVLLNRSTRRRKA